MNSYEEIIIMRPSIVKPIAMFFFEVNCDWSARKHCYSVQHFLQLCSHLDASGSFLTYEIICAIGLRLTNINNL